MDMVYLTYTFTVKLNPVMLVIYHFHGSVMGKWNQHPENFEIFGDVQNNRHIRIYLEVGGWTNPSEKYARQIESFPRGSGWKYKIFETATEFMDLHFPNHLVVNGCFWFP